MMNNKLQYGQRELIKINQINNYNTKNYYKINYIFYVVRFNNNKLKMI